ncbi:phage baseplate assembly protein V [Achromobacter insuavis]|uniref:phage baseplate assembly protein V n=1 Tax=Achromobacter insuavis TaxID=1287735 RepID=UPI001EEB0880|nr:phage baseplate assembly protein V [Achromobacter insuavis]
MSISSALNRIRLAIARALVGQVNDSGGLQIVQIGIQADVGRDQVERFQQYGMTSVPHPGAECVTLSVGGNTDHQAVINVDDRRYRMRGLKTGEMAIYDDQGMSVHLTRDGIVIRGAGKPMRLTDTSGIELDSDVHVTRGLRVDGDLELRGNRATHNGTDIGHQHKHGGVQEGDDTSGTPVG